MKSVLLPYILQTGTCFLSVKNKHKRRKELDTSTEDSPDQKETDSYTPHQFPLLIQNLQESLLLFHIIIPLDSTVATSIHFPRLILPSFSELPSVKTVLWLLKQTPDRGAL